MLELLLSYDPAATDAFRPGFYRWERRDHVPVPVRVWFGQPRDPLTGELLDRAWRWQFEFNGMPLETYAAALRGDAEELLGAFWPRAAKHEIAKSEYDYLLATVEHAREHDSSSPFSTTRGRVDLLSAGIPDLGD
jgi:hypothetical protein